MTYTNESKTAHIRETTFKLLWKGPKQTTDIVLPKNGSDIIIFGAEKVRIDQRPVQAGHTYKTLDNVRIKLNKVIT